jgi:predicted transcriptional regulator
MNVLISDYFNTTQIIKCNNGHEFPYEMLPMLKRYKMRCPDCMDEEKSGICEVTLSNVELKEKLKSIEIKRYKNFNLLEFQILDYLNTIKKAVSINKISSSVDKSETSITKNINKLIERGLVSQDNEASRALRKEVYQISEKGTIFMKVILDLIKKTTANNV